MVNENEANAEAGIQGTDATAPSTTSTPHSPTDLPEILLVEDSQVEAELLRRLLTRAGYAVSMAQNGKEGLQAARARRPTLILSDINMPLMNGYQLCRAIKFDEEMWNVPLILLTVLSEPKDIIEAINSGADAYIVKPFAEVNLLERIRSLLDAPLKRRRAEERREEVVSYGGQRHAIVGGGQQILNLLLSLYENMLNQNRELVAVQSQLNLLNEDLDQQVCERTAALQKSEARFRNIVETTSDWIWEVNENGVYTYASPRIHNLLGYLPEEVIGKAPFDLMPNEEAQRVAKVFAVSASTHEAIVNLENINLHLDGHRVVLETSAVPIIDIEGNFRGYRGIDRDITERKRTEEVLQQSEFKLRESQRVAQIGSWEWDAINDTIWWSDEYYHIYGLDPKQPTLNYREHLKIYTRESAEQLDILVKHATETGEPYEIELELAQPSPFTRWIVARGEAKRDASGKIWGLRGTAQDITERKKSEELVQGILECVDEGFIIIDRDFRILAANKAYSKLVEMPIDKIIGKHCYESCHHNSGPCSISEYDCTVQRVFTTGKSHSAIHKHEDAKGEVAYIETKAYPHSKDNTGKVMTAIVTIVDITEKCRLEDQLRQAQKMEAIGTLAGGIAHDFNNILAPILGYSEMAVDKLSPGDPLAADLQQVIRAAGQAKGLVQQILSISRHAPQESKLLQPQLVVKEALNLLRASLPSTIEIRMDIPAECGTILGDPIQLHQIIMNLCTNAYHAMRKSGGVLGVRLAKVTIDDTSMVPNSELAPGEYVLIEVSDTGCGMEQKTLAHIFEPYFTTKAKGEGTGLGLSIVHGIVKSYQGYITVYSEPGKGTRFHVYLPRTAEAPSLEAVSREAIPTGTERLLVVDDNEVLATMLQRMLQGLGYQVRSSCNSLEALALIEQDPMAFDLLITDMTMPHLTGFELSQKALTLRADLPIILCTGFSDLINKEQAQALGIRAYLMKPVSSQDLGQTVRTVLDAKSEFS